MDCQVDCHGLPWRAAACAFSKVSVLKTALWNAETPCRTDDDVDADADDDAEGALEGALKGALEGAEGIGGQPVTSPLVRIRSRSRSSGTEPRSSSARHQRSSREACSSEVASTEETIAVGRYSTLRK